MFLLKKLISRLLFPLPLGLELMLAGWLLHRFTQKKRTGLALVWAGGVAICLAGTGVGTPYLRHLERTYPPFGIGVASPEALTGTDIVVLGPGLSQEPDLPSVLRTDPCIVRLLEGVRVHRLVPGSRILLSMGGGISVQERQAFVDEFAGVVGLSPAVFVLLGEAWDTAGEARAAREAVRTNRIVLVTSASHMPRAVSLFEREGFDVVPAPCDYQVRRGRGWGLGSLIPSASGLAQSEAAAYEALGNLWVRVFGGE